MIEPKPAVPVTEEYLKGGKWEVDIAGRLYPAVVSARPMYESKRLGQE